MPLITGTPNDDALLGTLGDDSLVGLEGNDNIRGNDGDDLQFGNAGQDSLSGDRGDDTLLSGKDNDVISGGEGDDLISGDSGSDVVRGDAGEDIIFGNLDDDSLFGGDDNDFLFGGEGNDTLYGEIGNDVLAGDRGADVLIGGTGKNIYVLDFKSGGPNPEDADLVLGFDADDQIAVTEDIDFAEINIAFVRPDPDSTRGNYVFSNLRTGEYLAILANVTESVLTDETFTTEIVPSDEPDPGPPTPPSNDDDDNDGDNGDDNDGDNGDDNDDDNGDSNNTNTRPVASDGVLVTEEDVDVGGALNATDADGDSLTYTKVSNPSNGTVSVNATTGTFTYYPNDNFSGSDRFTYKVNDGTEDSAEATISITVNSIEDELDTQPDTATVSEDGTATNIDVLANDSDDGTLTVASVNTPGTRGVVTNNGSNVTYDPNGQFESLAKGATATDIFTYTVTNAGGSSETQTVTVTVNGVNDAPTAADGSIDNKVLPGTNYTFETADFPFSDVDSGDSLGGIEITSLETAGDLEANGTDVVVGTTVNDITQLVFKPGALAGGASANFGFKVKDSNGALSASSYTMTINLVDDTPIVDLNGSAAGVDASATYTEDDTGKFDIFGTGTGQIDPANLNIIDPSENIEKLTVIINPIPDNSSYEEKLELDDSSSATISTTLDGTMSGGGGSYRIELTSSDPSATTPADFATILQTLKYSNTNTQSPDETPRTITITAEDSDGNSSTSNIAFTVDAVNDAPTVDNSNGTATDYLLTTIAASNTDSAGDTIQGLVGNLLAASPAAYDDPDNNPDRGIVVTQVDNTHGLWQYSTDGGTNWNDFSGTTGSVVPLGVTSRLLSADDTNNKIRFVPANDFGAGDSAGDLTFRAWDRTTGTDGGTADPGAGGGSTAFSTDALTASINVSLNPPPTLVSEIENQGIVQGSSVNLDVSGNFDDNDVATLDFTATGLPTGLSISSAGVISGTAPNNFTFTEVTVTAEDADNQTVSDSFYIGVVESVTPGTTTGNDNTTGDNNSNFIDGKAGDDVIQGDPFSDGTGTEDILIGGDGQDKFVYQEFHGSDGFTADSSSEIDTQIGNGGYDIILDFNPNDDKIVFDDYSSVDGTEDIQTAITDSSTDFTSNVLSGKRIFAYRNGSDLFLLRDSNGDNTSAEDNRIIARLIGQGGISDLSAAEVSGNIEVTLVP